MHRLTQLSVKESTNRIVRRRHQTMSTQKGGLYGFNANPELKLEYTPSILSTINESATLNGSSATADTDVADTEEGIKRYT